MHEHTLSKTHACSRSSGASRANAPGVRRWGGRGSGLAAGQLREVRPRQAARVGPRRPAARRCRPPTRPRGAAPRAPRASREKQARRPVPSARRARLWPPRCRGCASGHGRTPPARCAPAGRRAPPAGRASRRSSRSRRRRPRSANGACCAATASSSAGSVAMPSSVGTTIETNIRLAGPPAPRLRHSAGIPWPFRGHPAGIPQDFLCTARATSRRPRRRFSPAGARRGISPAAPVVGSDTSAAARAAGENAS